MKTPNTFGYSIVSVSFCFVAMLISFIVDVLPVSAQEKKPTLGNVRELEQQQKQLAQRFGKLEELFIRMGELEAVWLRWRERPLADIADKTRRNLDGN